MPEPRLIAPRNWGFALRYLWRFKVRNRHIATRGFVYVAPEAEVSCRRGLGRMELGRAVRIGRGDAIRCHEGSLRIGDDVVFGSQVTVNCYLDVEIGDDCLVADRVYVGDFDHRFEDSDQPIRAQGIVASPVRIERDCWLGEGAAVMRGVTVGAGSVVGARAVVTDDVPEMSVAVGAPARVVRRRGDDA